MNRISIDKLLLVVCLFVGAGLLSSWPVRAIEMTDIHWYDANHLNPPSEITITQGRLQYPIDSFRLTGGTHVSELRFSLTTADDYVIDFRNSALIGVFHHWLYDENGQQIAYFDGGLLDSDTHNDYFLRNGRDVRLPEGKYRLVTWQSSQFNIAPPTPFIMSKTAYMSEIKLGNSITLLGLGILFGLFFYYLVLSITRHSWVDFSYAGFILGNLLFNATSLLVLPQLVGIHWYGGASWPILFSNIAYLLFVLQLLGIKRENDRWIWRLGVGLIALFSLFVLLSTIFVNLQNEFNRFAVGLFLLYGVVAGGYKVWQGHIIARWYLVANFGFVLFGSIAISQEQIAGLKTIYMAHLGLIAVVCEVLMLSCVIAYQMTRLQQEKAVALRQAEAHLKQAKTDALTQLPNRYAMEEGLQQATPNDVFVYVDLDGLKRCNDNFGHEMGDNLLVSFGEKLSSMLPEASCLYRISGDEFGIISPEHHQTAITQVLEQLDQDLKYDFLPNVGVSFGIAHFEANRSNFSAVKQADERMFEHKRAKYQYADRA